jgi:hypothetical protein
MPERVQHHMVINAGLCPSTSVVTISGAHLVFNALHPLRKAQRAECLLQGVAGRAYIGHHDGLGIAPQTVLCDPHIDH